MFRISMSNVLWRFWANTGVLNAAFSPLITAEKECREAILNKMNRRVGSDNEKCIFRQQRRFRWTPALSYLVITRLWQSSLIFSSSKAAENGGYKVFNSVAHNGLFAQVSRSTTTPLRTTSKVTRAGCHGNLRLTRRKSLNSRWSEKTAGQGRGGPNRGTDSSEYTHSLRNRTQPLETLNLEQSHRIHPCTWRTIFFNFVKCWGASHANLPLFQLDLSTRWRRSLFGCVLLTSGTPTRMNTVNAHTKSTSHELETKAHCFKIHDKVAFLISLKFLHRN